MPGLAATTNFGNTLLTGQVEANLVDFFRWGFVNAGGFTNVGVTTPGTIDPYSDCQLFPVNKDGATPGTIWQAVHPDWCYEAGLDFATQPTVASGVYVNGTFHAQATTTGTYAHTLDFVHGRVVFANPIPLTSLLQVPYSYRWASIYSQDVPWFRPVVLNEFLSQQFQQYQATGVTALLDDYRIECPFILVEAIMRRSLKGRMLGSHSMWVGQDVLFHVFADRKDDRDQMVDAIVLQKDTTIPLYDVNARRTADDYVLTYAGAARTGSQYPTLASLPPAGYAYKNAWFSDMRGEDVDLKLPLFRGIVRATLTVDS